MQFHYRIYDERTNEIHANGIHTYEQAFETLELLLLDLPNSHLTIESYRVYPVRGLGRDPDLH